MHKKTAKAECNKMLQYVFKSANNANLEISCNILLQ